MSAATETRQNGWRLAGWRPEMDVERAVHWALSAAHQNGDRALRGAWGPVRAYAKLAGPDWERAMGGIRLHRDAVILWLVVRELGLMRLPAFEAAALQGGRPYWGEALPTGGGFRPIVVQSHKGPKVLELCHKESYWIERPAFVREGHKVRQAGVDRFHVVFDADYCPVLDLGQARAEHRATWAAWWRGLLAIRRFVRDEQLDLALRLTGPSALRRPWLVEETARQACKLAPADRQELRALAAAGLSPAALARRYGVTRMTVWRIVNAELSPGAAM